MSTSTITKTKHDAESEQIPNEKQRIILKSSKSWLVEMPPPASSVKGHLLPKVHRHRRISLDTYLKPCEDQNTASPSESSSISSSESTILRIFSELKHHIHGNPFHRKSSKEGNDTESVSTIGLGGFEDNDYDDHDNDIENDSYSVNTELSGATYNSASQFPVPQVPQGWKLKYNFSLANVDMESIEKRHCFVSTKINREKIHRELIFGTELESKEFYDYFCFLKRQEELKALQSFKQVSVVDKVTESETITFLIEVVSAWNLKSIKTIHPYVDVVFQDNVVHQTKHIPNTDCPIWTIETDSLFLLKTTPKELFLGDKGLLFDVRCRNRIGSNESLGYATFTPSELFSAKGERFERELISQTEHGNDKGTISIRCRHATKHDLEFLDAYKKHTKFDEEDIELWNSQKSNSKIPIANLIKKNKQTEDGIVRYRVRPVYDEENKLETKWMTKAQIEYYSQQESRKWISTGSGELARIYLEIIGCDDLMDADSRIANSADQSDPFISIIYEDTYATTDTIDHCLSPRWMPWSKRAFILHMMHPSSVIYLAAFDYDTVTQHDFLGRTKVNIKSFEPDTTYHLRYELQLNKDEPKNNVSAGFVNIRLRIQYRDARKIFLESLKMPPVFYVTTRTRKQFLVTRQTVHEKINPAAYSLNTLLEYYEELLAYFNFQIFIKHGLRQLFLWRCEKGVSVKIPGINRSITVFIPFSSIITFVTGTTLVEYPNLAPSCFFASIAWLLFTTSYFQGTNPNSWHRSKSFFNMMEVFLFGKSSSPPVYILRNENRKEVEEFEAYWANLYQQADESANKAREELIRVQEEHAKNMESIGGTDFNISNKEKVNESLKERMFKFVLYPVQRYLGIACYTLRFSRNVILWDECYYSFWLCNGSIVLAVVFLFVPWGFVIRWTARILTWTLLGPWMKLADIFYFSKFDDLTEEQKEEALINSNVRRYEESNKQFLLDTRINQEKAIKLKAMKKYMFGEFIVWAPTNDLSQDLTKPLIESSAEPYTPKKLTVGELAITEGGQNVQRIDGQRLEGDMIPVRVKAPTGVETGQLTNDPKLLAVHNVGTYPGKASLKMAIAKIGGLVAAAGVASWYTVPILIGAVKWVTTPSKA